MSPDNPGGAAESSVVHSFDVDLTNPGFNIAFAARLNPSESSSNFLPQDFSIGNVIEHSEKTERSKPSNDNAHQTPVFVTRLPETNMAANLF